MDSATDKIRFACGCGARIGVPLAAAGKRVRCPKCQSPVRVPQADDAESEQRGDHSDHADRSAMEQLASAANARTPEAGLVESLESLMDGETLRLAPEPPPAAPIAPAKAKAAAARGPGAARLHLFDGSLDDDAPEGPEVACPCCEKQYRSGVKICVECGIDIKTGRALQTRDESTLDRTYDIAEPTIEWISYVFRIGIYPVASDAFGVRTPWAIRVFAAIIILVSGWYWAAYIFNPDPPRELAMLMLWSGSAARQTPFSEGMGFRWYQPFTSALLHEGPIHLVGNLLFLFVFGSRVNALIGNILTVAAIPLLALCDSAASDISRQGLPMMPSLGASGVIMGFAGMYLVLMPLPNVHLAGWYRWGWYMIFGELHMNIWAVRGFWVVLSYIALDALSIWLNHEDGVGHWAHVGGFIGGVVLALLLLFTRLVNARGGDVLSALCGRAAWPLIGKPNRPPRTLW